MGMGQKFTVVERPLSMVTSFQRKFGAGALRLR
jgi:hypothetical protein